MVGPVTLLPPTPKSITGRSLAHQILDKRQRACLAADVAEGLVQLGLTQAQLATVFDVSPSYVALARKLPAGKRAAILRGWDPTSFASLMIRKISVPAKSVVNTDISDSDLVAQIRAIGLDRVLTAAVVAEAAE
jgi:hypothetical protein